MKSKKAIHKTICIVASLVIAFSAAACGADSEDSAAEVETTDMSYEVEFDAAALALNNKPEDSAYDFSGLEKEINEIISETKEITGGEWSVYVKVPKNESVLSINQQPMQAASVIKIFIMGAVYEQYDELKEFYLYDDIDGLIESMIIISDNEAADLLVAMLGRGDSVQGRAVVNKFCEEHGFTNTTMERMMADDNIYSDNYTTTEDCAKFLEMLFNGELDRSKDMLNYLCAQERTYKIPAGIPDNVKVGNKTGELDDVQNDAAIVFTKYPYIICVMSDGVADYEASTNAVVDISAAVYDRIIEAEEYTAALSD